MTMLRVALTGGIGSGKTTAARFFEKLGVAVIDADVIARQVVEPDSEALTEIIKHFGSDILTLKGQLNREKLRQIIFENPQDRQFLEKLLHPLIRDRINTQVEKIAEQDTHYCILVIPLLTASNKKEYGDRVLVIDTPETLQIQRTQQRDYSSPEHVKTIIQSQLSRSARLALADDVIVNDSTLEKLENKIKDLHHVYLSLSKGKKCPVV